MKEAKKQEKWQLKNPKEVREAIGLEYFNGKYISINF